MYLETVHTKLGGVLDTGYAVESLPYIVANLTSHSTLTNEALETEWWRRNYCIRHREIGSTKFYVILVSGLPVMDISTQSSNDALEEHCFRLQIRGVKQERNQQKQRELDISEEYSASIFRVDN